VYHVQMIAVINRKDFAHRLVGSQLLVGNSTDYATNPSCGVVVDTGGFYGCDLWGRYVALRRASGVIDNYNIG